MSIDPLLHSKGQSKDQDILPDPNSQLPTKLYHYHYSFPTYKNKPHHQPLFQPPLQQCLTDSPPSVMTLRPPPATSSRPTLKPLPSLHHDTQTHRSRARRLPSFQSTSTLLSGVCDQSGQLRNERWLTIRQILQRNRIPSQRGSLRDCSVERVAVLVI